MQFLSDSVTLNRVQGSSKIGQIETDSKGAQYTGLLGRYLSKVTEQGLALETKYKAY